MDYVSTRGGIAPIRFRTAVMMGLADDGGLLVPASIPDARDRLADWRSLDYDALALEVMSPFVDGGDRETLARLVGESYREPFPGGVAPVVPVGDLHVMELWHGPTLAFKDVALQLLGRLFEAILAGDGGVINILGATSGDTGSAAIHGVRGRDRIEIFMMHPGGRVSELQALQMTTVLDANVHNIAVEGSFDDCQTILKQVSGDVAFKRRHALGAVNSVNWARVLAQIAYYFHGAFRVQEATGCDAVRVAVPTGNFGDVLAGWYARRMGAPISRLILATNENDILARFFRTGVYGRGEVHRTLSPSMDIQVASNFERYLHHRVGSDPARLRALMEEFARTARLRLDPPADDPDFVAGSADTERMLETIARYHRDHDYLLDPHTAVGVAVAGEVGLAGDPVLCLATAHPAKFPEAIRRATGRDLARHPTLEALRGAPVRLHRLPGDPAAIRAFIEETLARRPGGRMP